MSPWCLHFLFARSYLSSSTRSFLFFLLYFSFFFCITFCLPFRLPMTLQFSLLRLCVNIFLYFLSSIVKTNYILFLLLVLNAPLINHLFRYIEINHNRDHLFENLFPSFYFKGNGFCTSLIDHERKRKKKKTDKLSYFYWIFFLFFYSLKVACKKTNIIMN